MCGMCGIQISKVRILTKPADDSQKHVSLTYLMWYTAETAGAKNA